MSLSPDTISIWIYDYNRDLVVRNSPNNFDYFSTDKLIAVLNNSFPNIQLRKNQLFNDTLYVEIEDSKFFTQQIGTAGAQSYLSIATYTLTEPEEISYINFDFEIGDHAMPGTYSRADFRGETQIND